MGPSSCLSLENAPWAHGQMDTAIFLKPLSHLFKALAPKLSSHNPLLWCFKLELVSGWVARELDSGSWWGQNDAHEWRAAQQAWSLSGSGYPEARTGAHITHCLVSKPISALFQLTRIGFSRLQAENPNDFATPHNQHDRNCNNSYLGSFSEEKGNFRIIVVAGSLQRSLSCLRKGTRKDNWVLATNSSHT